MPRTFPLVRTGAALGLALSLVSVAPAQSKTVVCYVSHDFEHSEVVLKAFEAATGIKVDAVSDTEDNKTIGLANRLIAEAGRTKADVFWNNEVGQAARLKAKGLLEPYVSPHAATIPPMFKDSDGAWTGFAARARVLIYNVNLIQPDELPTRYADLGDPKFKGKGMMARPLTGTTLTHTGVLIAKDGWDSARATLERFIANDVQFEKGNAYVMKQVAEGVRPFGMTDTDDARVAELDGKPTKIAYLDQEPGGVGTLLIPNSVMMMKGAPHPAEARALIDFLLRPETEAMLAQSRAAQIPLHPGVPRPPHVKGGDEIRAMTVDWAAAGAAIDEKLLDLQNLFERPKTAAGGATGEPSAKEGSRVAWIGLGAIVLIGAALGLVRRRRERSTAA